MQDRIEQQIVIHAPLDRVWDLVSVPGWWVPTEVETEPDERLAPGPSGSRPAGAGSPSRWWRCGR